MYSDSHVVILYLYGNSNLKNKNVKNKKPTWKQVWLVLSNTISYVMCCRVLVCCYKESKLSFSLMFMCHILLVIILLLSTSHSLKLLPDLLSMWYQQIICHFDFEEREITQYIHEMLRCLGCQGRTSKITKWKFRGNKYFMFVSWIFSENKMVSSQYLLKLLL